MKIVDSIPSNTNALNFNNFTDLVSKYILVIKSKNPAIENIKGYCIFETKNMLLLEKTGRIIQVQKNGQSFRIYEAVEDYEFKNLDLKKLNYVDIEGFKINNNIYKRNSIIL